MYWTCPNARWNSSEEIKEISEGPRRTTEANHCHNLQNCYGIALRSNNGNLDNMKKLLSQVCSKWLHQKAIHGITIVHKGRIAWCGQLVIST